MTPAEIVAKRMAVAAAFSPRAQIADAMLYANAIAAERAFTRFMMAATLSGVPIDLDAEGE